MNKSPFVFDSRNSWSLLAQSNQAIVAPNDTLENILASIVIPANSMGSNGRIRISTIWGYDNNANVKTARVRFNGIAGTMYMSINLVSSASYRDVREIINRGAINSQVGFGSGGNGGFGSTGVATTTSAVDTSADVPLLITAQKATAGDVVRLESYLVELLSA